MKAIFLDIDGVMTSPESDGKICEEKIRLLEDLVKRTGANVILSSSWRGNCYQDAMINLSNRANYLHGQSEGMVKLIDDSTPLLYAFKLGQTQTHYALPRGVEIDRFLRDCPLYTEYVILDDRDDMLISQQKHLVRVDKREGLTEKDVERAVQILEITTL